MKKLLIFALLLTSLVGCSEDEDKTTKKTKAGSAETFSDDQLVEQAPTLTVLNEIGLPIPNAQVLIGPAQNVPFENNWLTTDAAGILTLPAEWTQPLPLTVQAPGFVRVTYLNVQPADLKLQLRFASKIPNYEVSGLTTGHSIVDRDDKIDFGIIMNAFTRNDMMAFDMTKVMSLESDTLTVAGYDAPVPSNVTLPKQKESYFIPITIEKPGYRIYFPRTGNYKVFAAKGQFPFDKVVDELRNKKEFYELVNYFNITGGSLKDVTVTNAKSKMDINVNDMQFGVKKLAIAPRMNANEVLMAVSAIDQGGYFLPADVKRLTSGQQMPLNTQANSKQMFMGVLKRQDEFESNKPGLDRMSAGLYDFQDKISPTLLPLIPNPKLDTAGNLILQTPPVFTGLNPTGMQTMLSEVVELQKGKEKVIFLNRLWEVYSNEWLGIVDLPEVPATLPAAKKLRWEAAYIGSTAVNQPQLGPSIIENATHVTHSSIDF